MFDNTVSPTEKSKGFKVYSFHQDDDQEPDLALETAYAPLLTALKCCGLITGPMVDRWRSAHVIYAVICLLLSLKSTSRFLFEFQYFEGFGAAEILNLTCLLWCACMIATRLVLVYHSYTGKLRKLLRSISKTGTVTNCPCLFSRTRKLLKFVLVVDTSLLLANNIFLVTLWVTNASDFSIAGMMKSFDIKSDMTDIRFIFIVISGIFEQLPLDSTWHFSFALLATLCYTVIQQFDEVRDQTEQAIVKAGKMDSNVIDLEEYREKWLLISDNIDQINIVFKHIIWVSLLFHFTAVTTILFAIINGIETSIIWIALMILWFGMCLSYLILTVKVLSQLNKSAHSFIGILYRVKLKQKHLTDAAILSLHLFISSQTDQVKGARVLGMFPLTPSSIFNVMTALVSYFLLLISFKGGAAAGSTPDFANASHVAGFNNTLG